MLNHTRTDGVGLHMRFFFYLVNIAWKRPVTLIPMSWFRICTIFHVVVQFWAAGRRKQTFRTVSTWQVLRLLNLCLKRYKRRNFWGQARKSFNILTNKVRYIPWHEMRRTLRLGEIPLDCVLWHQILQNNRELVPEEAHNSTKLLLEQYGLTLVNP